MILDSVDLGIMKDMKLCYKISDSVAGGEWGCMVTDADGKLPFSFK